MAFAARWLESKTGRLTLAGFALALFILGALLLLLPRSVNPPAQNVAEDVSSIPAETRARIDRWISTNKLNQYGDPPDTMYAGGSPLFDPRTGGSKDRYLYILEKHPELRTGRE